MTTATAEAREKGRRDAASFRTFARLWGRFAPVWPAACGVVLLAFLRTALDLAPPTVLAYAIGMLGDVQAQGALPDVFLTLLWVLGALLLFRNFVFYGTQVAQAALAQKLENRLRWELFEKVLRLRFAYHDENRSGKTIARSLRDMEKARHFFREVAYGYLEASVLIVGVLVMSFWQHWSYGLAVAATMLPSVLITLLVGRRCAAMDRDVSDDYDRVTTVLQENVAGARVVRAFGRERQESSKFGGSLGSFTRTWQGLSQYWTTRIPYIHALFALGVPLALLIGVYRLASGAGHLGEIMAILLYVRTVRHRLRPLTRLVILGQEANASASRVFEVLDRDDVITAPAEPRRLPPEGGDLRLEDVHFGHPGGADVIRGLSLHVPAGGSLGILGPTGSGKSSLVQLLPRFYDPDEGRILLDGIDVRELDVIDLRAAVGLVFQEPFLFSATVADNVAYGRPDVSREDVERCARLAAAHGFVTGLPDGYETIIGERGVSLSGGQRQRLTIARALAMDPRVLVFDDATASVDAVTEKALFDGIRAAARGRTTLVISQRVTSVRWCDRIAVIEAGRLTGLGTHEELGASHALYQEIFEHQRLTTPTGAAP
jgi:ATP-binding cassette subfamily B protein